MNTKINITSCFLVYFDPYVLNYIFYTAQGVNRFQHLQDLFMFIVSLLRTVVRYARVLSVRKPSQCSRVL